MNDVPSGASALSTLEIRLGNSVTAVEPEAWDRLVGDGSPFVEHAWLRAMEGSGAVAPEHGWLPQPLFARLEGRLVGAVPLYLKAHSFGEYVYDWAWADLAQRIGAQYYPKLIAASPFSPVTGARVLVDPALEADSADAVFDALVAGALAAADTRKAKGLHFLFITADEARRFAERGFIIRRAHQYHWANDGYGTFDDFLARFASKKRRELRRERRRVAEAGYRVEAVSGTELTEVEMDALFRFYATTCDRYMWGRRYLDREFFADIHRSMPERIVAMLAKDADGTVVAGTFNVRKGDRIYGRYWGSDVEVPHLHFETCYYATLDYAIAEGLKAMEPGAGGDHKYARGFDPVTTYSAHWIAEPRLRDILAMHVEQECAYVDELVERMVEASPLRKT